MMEINDRSIAELTRAVEQLGDNINHLFITMYICLFATMLFFWLIIRHYKSATSYSLGSFDADKASKLYDAGKLSDLLAYCKKFHKKYPNDVNVLFHLGLAHYALGSLGESQQYFERATELNPHYRETVSPYLDEIAQQEAAAKGAMAS